MESMTLMKKREKRKMHCIDLTKSIWIHNILDHQVLTTG